MLDRRSLPAALGATASQYLEDDTPKNEQCNRYYRYRLQGKWNGEIMKISP